MDDQEYERLDIPQLTAYLRRARVPLFVEGKQPGFYVRSQHGVTTALGLEWRNVDSGVLENHKDMAEKLASAMRRDGYEVRVRKPAGTTLMVRRPKEYITIADSTFESVVERLCSTGRDPQD